MKVISLKCNNCSADLEIPENTKFFNCTFCHSSLAIQHFGNTVFTEVIQDLKKDTAKLLDHSESILLEKQISRLDRDWEATTKSLSIQSYRRSPIAPSMSQLWMICFALVFTGIGYFINISLFTPVEGLTKLIFPAPFSPINIISFCFFLTAIYLLWLGINIYRKATRYQEVKMHYQKQRQQLLQQLEKAQKH